ncbi:unnamed protein product [Moneuplotes crassus]|uniref:Uncharacterized protein n=1 Tax=Euplotes crassus TaxID=5936 RepID=A0AAD2CWE1_EUPCR|nr:unnamed protein product [Moneuplotes crassus]
MFKVIEITISRKEKQFDKEIFKLVRRDTYHYSRFSSNSASFIINLIIPSANKFIKKMKYTALPELNKFSLHCFPPRNKTTDSFISNCFPRSVKCMVAEQEFILKPIRGYFTELIRVAPKVQQEVSFRYFTINDREFKRIISAVRHVRKVFFAWCEISVTKVPDFSFTLDKTRLEELSMQNCSYGHNSNLKQNSKEFKNLIQGLGTSQDLKQSLKLMNIKSQMLEIGDIRNTLNENGLEGVRLSL